MKDGIHWIIYQIKNTVEKLLKKIVYQWVEKSGNIFSWIKKSVKDIVEKSLKKTGNMFNTTKKSWLESVKKKNT
jgi:hypothetical protein